MKSDKKPGAVVAFFAIITGGITFALFAFGAITIEAIAAMIAWGLFMPSVFGLKDLSFHEAIGLVLLANFVLMPLVIPLNQINSTMSKYAKHRTTTDLIASIKAMADANREESPE